MTVKELKEELKKYPDDAVVFRSEIYACQETIYCTSIKEEPDRIDKRLCDNWVLIV